MRKVRSRLPLPLGYHLSHILLCCCEADKEREAFSDPSVNIDSNSWSSPMFLTKVALALWSFVEACSPLFLRRSSPSIKLDEEQFDG